MIFLALVENGLVGIAVGDINQAIYGFSNRFPKYLISLMSNERFHHFELSKNHRCHPSISEYSLGLFGALKTLSSEKRVFLVNVAGNENNIATQIDRFLPQIKKKYNIKNNNQMAILCRGNSTIQLMDQSLTTAHKIFVETPLDRDNSEWGRLFHEIITSCFDPNIFAVEYAEQLFPEDSNSKKYHKALTLCSKIFASNKNTITSAMPDIIKLARLVYPQRESSSAINSLTQVLHNDVLLNSYVPASEDEINLMTLHKSKGLEFNIVFHLDLYRWIFPNEYGDSDAQIQDLNLHYVGVTRAIDACYLMNGSMRYRKRNDDFIPSVPSPFLSIPGLAEKRRTVRWG